MKPYQTKLSDFQKKSMEIVENENPIDNILGSFGLPNLGYTHLAIDRDSEGCICRMYGTKDFNGMWDILVAD